MRPGGWSRSLRREVEGWAAGFDPSLRSARFWGRTIAVSSALTIGLVAILSFAPGLREFFGLRPAVPLAFLGLRAAGYFVLERFERRQGTNAVYFAVAALTMGFGFQLVTSSLVVFSEAPGSFVLAVLPVVGAAYYCMILRATPAFPWPALVHGLAMATALALRPGSPRLEIFSVAGPLAVGVGLFLGMLGETMARARQTLDEHRRAIEVHALEERTGEARRLSSSLLELLQRSHDANSALSTALLDFDVVAGLARQGGTPDAASIGSATAALRGSLQRAGQILGAPPGDRGSPAGSQHDAAPVMPAVRAALAQVARRFPEVRLETLPVEPAAGTAVVVLHGGGEELERLVAELVKNACEGSGARRAARVSVRVDACSDPGAVAIRVVDDGPGFPVHVLEATPTAFVTTKPSGSGLGLYTVDRVVAANGGSLSLENAPGGGSAVTLRLPRR